MVRIRFLASNSLARLRWLSIHNLLQVILLPDSFCLFLQWHSPQMAWGRSFAFSCLFMLRVESEIIRLINLVTSTCVRPFIFSVARCHHVIITRIMVWSHWPIFNALINAIVHQVVGAPPLSGLELVFGCSHQLLVVAYRPTSAVLNSRLVLLILEFVKKLGIEVYLSEFCVSLFCLSKQVVDLGDSA